MLLIVAQRHLEEQTTAVMLLIVAQRQLEEQTKAVQLEDVMTEAQQELAETSQELAEMEQELAGTENLGGFGDQELVASTAAGSLGILVGAWKVDEVAVAIRGEQRLGLLVLLPVLVVAEMT